MRPLCTTPHGHGSSGSSCLTPLLAPGLACVVRLARPSAKQHHSPRLKFPSAPPPASLPLSPSEGQCPSPAWFIELDVVTYAVRLFTHIAFAVRTGALLVMQLQKLPLLMLSSMSSLVCCGQTLPNAEQVQGHRSTLWLQAGRGILLACFFSTVRRSSSSVW